MIWSERSYNQYRVYRPLKTAFLHPQNSWRKHGTVRLLSYHDILHPISAQFWLSCSIKNLQGMWPMAYNKVVPGQRYHLAGLSPSRYEPAWFHLQICEQVPRIPSSIADWKENNVKWFCKVICSVYSQKHTWYSRWWCSVTSLSRS